MQTDMVYSEEQLARLRQKLAAVKEELRKEQGPDPKSLSDRVRIRVSEDEMTAWITLSPPGEQELPYTVPAVLTYLQEQGIRYGVQEERIQTILEAGIYETEVEIAKGTVMEEGKDGYYEYKFSPESHKAPKILENGSVDYTSMHMLQNVSPGDVLAIYHHACQGKEGHKVTGEVLKPAVAKEKRPLRGRNISNQQDPDVYVALIGGKVELRDDRIDIESVHEIQGDVGLLIGKIEFYGDIIINGNVEAGVVLRAGRNVIIRGTAEAVTIFAGGDIVLEHGVQGAQKGKLSARGSVFADFIEHCTVDAGQDVQANALMNSRVSAEGSVLLTGSRGRIIGGYTHGTKGIHAVSIGNMSEMKTVVHSGYETKTYEELMTLTEEEKEITEALNKLVDEMSSIIRKRQSGQGKNENLAARMFALNKEKNTLFERLDKVRSDLAFTRELVEKGRDSAIVVDGSIYRGVVVCVDNAKMTIERETCFMRYKNNGGVIESSVIVYH